MELKGVPGHPASEGQSQDLGPGLHQLQEAAWEQLGMVGVYIAEDCHPWGPRWLSPEPGQTVCQKQWS